MRVFIVLLLCVFIVTGCGGIGGRGGIEDPAKTKGDAPKPGTEEAESRKEKSETSKEIPSDMDEGYYVHTVRWYGETLSIIAKWYTGELGQWKAIARVNPDLDPNRIFRGNRIRIPEGLIKTRRPMPKQFLAEFLGRPKPKSPVAKPQAIKDEDDSEPELFGPKKASPTELQ
jgi:hypothetical protein